MSKILITSALPYVNGVKHLGNLVGSLLPADVHARFRRQTGDEVLFVCATDEHGTPAELGAVRAGQDIQTFCSTQHAIQADIYRRFGLSFDHFGRTSSPQNRALTQHFYRRLEESGLIEERTLQQVWSPWTAVSCQTATCSALARIVATHPHAAINAITAARSSIRPN